MSWRHLFAQLLYNDFVDRINKKTNLKNSQNCLPQKKVTLDQFVDFVCLISVGRKAVLFMLFLQKKVKFYFVFFYVIKSCFYQYYFFYTSNYITAYTFMRHSASKCPILFGNWFWHLIVGNRSIVLNFYQQRPVFALKNHPRPQRPKRPMKANKGQHSPKLQIYMLLSLINVKSSINVNIILKKCVFKKLEIFILIT